MFKIHYGHDKKGREKWARYATLEAAQRAANEVFAKTGIVLGIVADAQTKCNFCGETVPHDGTYLADHGKPYCLGSSARIDAKPTAQRRAAALALPSYRCHRCRNGSDVCATVKGNKETLCNACLAAVQHEWPGKVKVTLHKSA